MWKQWKKAAVVLMACTMLLNMTGCKKREEKLKEPQTEQKTRQKDEKEAESKEETIPANQNLLTGLADLSETAIGKRPVAVMVNNHEAARPQYGIAQADILYEIPVEGDITRLMALYADYTKVPQICPIRSCRYYFPALSQGYDAFYVNWGIDDGIADYLEALQLDQYDGIYNAEGLFGRDENRLAAGYSLEHTGYFDGTRFGEVAQAEGRRMDLAEDMRRTAFQFGSFKEPVSPKGESCKKVEINFGACVSSFEYDEATGTYQKSMNGTPHIDGNTNQPLTFINLFVLETEISVRDEVGHKNLDWDGGSDSVGYYISNGMIQKVQWAKEPNNERSKLAFYDETGNEIKVNRGKSYIALNYANQATFQ